MFHLGKGRRRGAAAALVAVVTTLGVMFVGAGAGGAAAAPAHKQMEGISNDLVEIEPAKIRGTFTNPDTGRKGAVIGQFVPESFEAVGNTLQVTGTVEGVFRGANLPEDTPRTFTDSATFEVTDASTPGGTSTTGFQSASFTTVSSHGCDILNLDLGPLDLNILGLQIDLAPVVLDIVAQPGAGALLGNLLCAVAGLLDGGLDLGGLLDDLLGGVADALTGLLGGALIDGLQGLIDSITEALGGLTGATQTMSA